MELKIVASCFLFVSASCFPMYKIPKIFNIRHIPSYKKQIRFHSIAILLKHFDEKGIHIRENLFKESSEQEKIHFMTNLTDYLQKNSVKITLFDPHVLLSACAMTDCYIEDCHAIQKHTPKENIPEQQKLRDLLYLLQICDYWEKVKKIS